MCNYCKNLLDCGEVGDIPWYEGGIYRSYNRFYLLPQLDGEQEDSLRPYVEIEYCPKCGEKLK